MKHTKKALFTSIVALLLCFTMLMGTTFAWFTDTATVKVNKIQAGNLDVELYGNKVSVVNGVSTVGEEIDYNKETQAAADALWASADGDLWEPGFTSYRIVKLVNAGNLAFEYAVDITSNGKTKDVADPANPVDSEFNLSDVIDVYFDIVEIGETVPTSFTTGDYKDYTPVGKLSSILGVTEKGVINGVLLPEDSDADETAFERKGEVYAVIALHMQESAGNDYQHLSQEFDIMVWAKQWTEEFDSTTDQYDKNAAYDENRKPDGGSTDPEPPVVDPEPDPEPTVDKTALNKAIEAATKLNSDDYVDFSAVTTALASANTVNADDNATQTEVDNAAKALNDAIEALVKKANKTNLAAAIEAATKLNSDDYVDFSAVTTALASANTVNAKIDATQTEVDNATEALNNAVSALEKKPVTPPAPTTSNISVTYVDAPASANVTNINTTAEYEEAYSFNVPSVDYYTVTVKQGETDVTASVADGKYTFNPNEENYNFTVTYTENVIMTITPIEGYLGSNVWAGDKSNMMFVDGATKLDEFFAAMQVENAVLRMYVTEGTVNEVFIQADEFGWGGYGCSGISVVDGVLSIKCSDILNAKISGELTSERINKWNNSGKTWGYVLFTGTQDNYTKLSNIVIVKP